MSIDKIIAALPDKSEADRKKMRTNAERWLATGTPAQQADASKLIEAQEALTVTERQTQSDHVEAMPITERVTEAFTKRPPTPNEETIIRALLNNPASTSTELSRACGWKGQIWHTHFGTMAKNREPDLWPAEPFTSRDRNFYSGILADLDPAGNRFTLKPEVAAAFAGMGISASVARPAYLPKRS